MIVYDHGCIWSCHGTQSEKNYFENKKIQRVGYDTRLSGTYPLWDKGPYPTAECRGGVGIYHTIYHAFYHAIYHAIYHAMLYTMPYTMPYGNCKLHGIVAWYNGIRHVLWHGYSGMSDAHGKRKWELSKRLMAVNCKDVRLGRRPNNNDNDNDTWWSWHDHMHPGS